MRVLILTLSVWGILVSADAAKAGLIIATRDVSASVDPSTLTDEATQETEDQIGLDKGNRRDVQRRLNGRGFHATTGFLNTVQHDALLTESVSAAHASTKDQTDNDHPTRAHRHRSGGGGPGGLIGGMMGGLFGRR